MGIQLGIIGYGGMGGFHHRNASKIEGVQVVGAYDIDPVRVPVSYTHLDVYKRQGRINERAD